MRVDPKGTLAGVNMKVLRDLFKKYMDHNISKELLCRELNLTRPQADDLFSEFVANELIVIEGKPPHTQYVLSTKGRSLALVHFIKPMTRPQIEKLAGDLVHRAQQINANADLLYTVKELHAFGSYLRDQADFGDLDVAVVLERRDGDFNWIERNQDRAEASGKQIPSFFERITFGYTEVLQLLKARKARISLHSIEDIEALGVESRLIFGATPLAQ